MDATAAALPHLSWKRAMIEVVSIVTSMISLTQALARLAAVFPSMPHAASTITHHHHRTIARLQSQSSLTEADQHLVIQYLSSQLVEHRCYQSPPHSDIPALTQAVVRLCRAHLDDIVQCIGVGGGGSEGGGGGGDYQWRFVVLCDIAILCPTTLPAIIHVLRAANQSPLVQAVSAPVSLIVASVHRLLTLDTPAVQSLWSWSPLYALLSHTDGTVRYHALQCVSRILNLNDNHRQSCYDTIVGNADILSDSHRQDVALQSERAAAFIDALDYDRKLISERGSVDDSAIDNIPSTTAVQAPLSSGTSTNTDTFITLSSTPALLDSLSLFLTQSRPILVTGSAGCGKSSLIHHIHSMTSPSLPLLTLHIDDSIDSKTLLGSYTCTDIPGEFRWSPGALTTAMTTGRTVLIEDIDRASFELMTGIESLFTPSQSLSIRGEVIRAKAGFRIFATRTVESHSVRKEGGVSTMIEAHFAQLSMPSLTLDDLLSVIGAKYAAIPEQWRLTVLKTFELFATVPQSSPINDTHLPLLSSSLTRSLPLSRKFSNRDLFRWCSRLATLFGRNRGWNRAGLNEEMNDDIMQSIMQVFISSLPPSPRSLSQSQSVTVKPVREQLLEAIVQLWSMPPERIVYHLQHYKPALTPSPTSLSIGAYTFPRPRSNDRPSSDRSFTATKHALRLMEKIASCIQFSEPTLLVGETGNGKTSIIQYLAQSLGKELIVINLNNQSDSSDLLGGFKPYEMGQLIQPLARELVDPHHGLFGKVMSRSGNAAWIQGFEKLIQKQEWRRIVKLMQGVADKAAIKLGLDTAASVKEPKADSARQSLTVDQSVKERWQRFYDSLSRIAHQLSLLPQSSSQSSQSLPLFHFSEGALVSALRRGDWLLLDEINLASSETLERITGLLDSSAGSLSLTERGDVDVIPRHADFRLFAAMNPSTDYGKKDLPAVIRARFSELYVEDVDDREDLSLITHNYLQRALMTGGVGGKVELTVDTIVRLYAEIRSLSQSTLLDGNSQHPHYSLRTYVRALVYASEHAPTYTLHRSLYEGLMMAFASPLNTESQSLVQSMIGKMTGVKQSAKGKSAQAPQPRPVNHRDIQSFWIQQGPEPVVDDSATFISTSTIESRLRDLARVLVSSRYPVLLQGPTSAGKTSLVSHLAKRLGHKLVRINNHAHTDISEYLGSYVTNARGELVFVEGVLVEAVRKGWWLVLDELNLAPSEVLEALNRLLDDNRQLFLPETQEVITPHPSFTLFATQNPPGVYGGRKQLSRAFANRFIVFHFDDLPHNELTYILEQRCQLPQSHASKMIGIMEALQQRRDTNSLFLGKSSLITPRDLFRWGERMRHASDSTVQTLAEIGFMMLGERLRTEDGKSVVRTVIEQVCNNKAGGSGKVSINDDKMYSMERVNAIVAQMTQGHYQSWQQCWDEPQLQALAIAAGIGDIAWTRSMRRMFVLAAECVQHAEPVLLVGETGTGKTTVCQIFALLQSRALSTINCHQYTETSDFIGGLRPIRNKESSQSLLRVQMRGLLEQLVSPAVPETVRELYHAVELPQSAEDLDASIKVVNQLSPIIRQAIDERQTAQQRLSQLALQESKRKRVKKSKDSKMLVDDGDDGIVDSCLDADISRSLTTLSNLIDSVTALHAHSQSLFEWVDGPLLVSMKQGHYLLIDEVSLADDAVLERLNPVLETDRAILVSEKGDNSATVITAHSHFAIFATMNPGGDFGKKELSPALRNRMTEIWIPGIESAEDLTDIVRQRLRAPAIDDDSLERLTSALVNFVRWFNQSSLRKRALSLRDVLAWVSFIKQTGANLGLVESFLHGSCLTLLDGLGIGSSESDVKIQADKQQCAERLTAIIAEQFSVSDDAVRGFTANVQPQSQSQSFAPPVPITSDTARFGVAPFYIPRGPLEQSSVHYSFSSTTPYVNLIRMLRSLHLPRAVLLEGDPGVGKTSLIASLAASAGHPLVRINLSEQTDMMDLLGVDLPVSGGAAGEFRWCDGIFLQALKQGYWVLLDELNLASQSVLEGLNAVLDHRGEVAIPELGQTFHPPPSFRIFASQNPMAQGGGRKGLPASFLNRFTKVHLSPLTRTDLQAIAHTLYPNIPSPTLDRMIEFNECVYEDTMVSRKYGKVGAPWEFNLRDIFRWCQLIQNSQSLPSPIKAADVHVAAMRTVNPGQFIDLVYLQRMRTVADRRAIVDRYRTVFGDDPLFEPVVDQSPALRVERDTVMIGRSCLTRNASLPLPSPPLSLPLLHSSLSTASHVLSCLANNYPALLIGSQAGKSTLVTQLSSLCNHPLSVLSVNESMDSSDLLGYFEQLDLSRDRKQLVAELKESVNAVIANLLTRLTQPSPSTQTRSNGKRKHTDELDKKKKKKRKHCNTNGQPTEAEDAVNDSDVITVVAQLERDVELIEASMTSESEATKSTAGFDAANHQRLTNVLKQLTEIVSNQTLALSLPSHLQPQTLTQSLERVLSLSSNTSIVGSFAWMDGTLIRALERGDWLLLENINYCSASVLDRLNALLEINGTLLVNECGMVHGQPRIIKPHKDFRFIGTMNAEYGEVSRAMRNRCVEIVCVEPLGHQPKSQHCEAARLRVDTVDLIRAINGFGVPGLTIPSFMATIHQALIDPNSELYNASISHRLPVSVGLRQLHHWCSLLVQQIHSGITPSLYQALTRSFHHAYTQLNNRALYQDVNYSLKALFPTSYQSLVAQSQSVSSLLAPGVWPAISGSHSASVFDSVARQGSIVRFIVQSFVCQQWSRCGTSTVSQGMQSVRALVRQSPDLAACLPDELLTLIVARDSSTLTITPRTTASFLVPTALVPALKRQQDESAFTAAELLALCLDRFVRRLSPVDVQARITFLRSIHAIAANDTSLCSAIERSQAVLTNIAQSELLVATGRWREQLAQSVGLRSTWLHQQPYDLRGNSPLLSIMHNVAGDDVVNQLLAVSQLVNMAIDRAERDILESAVYEAVEHSDGMAVSLSPIQQSFAHHHSLLRSRLQHELIAPFYSLFARLSTIVHQSLITVLAMLSSHAATEYQQFLSLIGALANVRDRYWTTLSARTSEFDTESAIVWWHALVKQVKSFQAFLSHPTLAPSLPPSLTDSVTSLIAQLFSLESILHLHSASASRWLMHEVGGHAMLPRTAAVASIRRRLLSLNEKVRWSSSDSNDSELAPFWLADREWKSTLIDAIADCAFIQHQSKSAVNSSALSSLLTMIEAVPQQLEDRLKVLTQEASQKRSRAIYSIKLLSKDESSLDDLGFDDFHPDAMNDSDSGPVLAEQDLTLRTDLSASVASNAELLKPLLPLLDYLVYQQLSSIVTNIAALMIAVGLNARVTPDELSMLSASIMRAVDRAVVHSSAAPLALAPFQSSQQVLDQLTSNTSVARLLPSLVADLLHRHQSFLHNAAFSARSNNRTAVVLTPFITIYVCSLLASASSVSLIDRHIKRAQLKTVMDAVIEQFRNKSQGIDTNNESQRQRALAITLLAHVLLCYLSTFDVADSEIVASLIHQLFAMTKDGVNITVPATALENTLGRSTDQRFRSLVHSHFAPAFRLLHLPWSTLTDAKFSLLVSLTRMQLYLPISPFDVARSHLIEHEDLSRQYELVLDRRQVQQWHDTIDHGGIEAGDYQWRHSLLLQSELQSKIELVDEKLTIRDSGARPFHHLFDELRLFVDNWDTKIQSLLSAVTTTANSMALAELNQLYEVATNFIAHLTLIYSQYEDVIDPIMTGIRSAQHALKQIAAASVTSQSQSVIVQSLRTLLSFPPLVSDYALESLQLCLDPSVLAAFDSDCQRAIALSKTNQVQSVDVSRLFSSRLSMVMTVLRRAVTYYQTQSTMATDSSSLSMYELFHSLFDTLVQAWHQQREQQRLKAEEEAAFYKFDTQSEVVVSEVERDEQLLREHYPNYQQNWSDIDGDSQSPIMDEIEEQKEKESLAKIEQQRKEREMTQSSALHISDDQMMEIHLIFTRIFESAPSKPREEELVEAFSAGHRAASAWLEAMSASSVDASMLAASMDAEFLPGHAFMLATRHHALHTLAAADTDAWIERESKRLTNITNIDTDNSDESLPLSKREAKRKAARDARRAEIAAMPDVWRAPNVEELRRLEPILVSVSARIRSILNDYPGQEMLVQMLRVIHRLSSLPSTTPVMELLVGTELLLRKTEEWKKFSARELSLANENLKLQALVIRWRKMELLTWPKSLRRVEIKAQIAAIQSFFHLWSLLNIEPEWASDSEEASQFFLSLHDTLSSWLRTRATIGEFETRLDLLGNFTRQLRAKIIDNQSHPCDSDSAKLPVFHRRLHGYLSNVHRYHSQYLPLINSFISHVAKPIEKSLTDQVKLARWDLGNYEQLRDASDKNHRRLVSYSRQYEDALKQSVEFVINTDSERRSAAKTVDFGHAEKELVRVRKQFALFQQSNSDGERGGGPESLSQALVVPPPDPSLYQVDVTDMSEPLPSLSVTSDTGRTRSLFEIATKIDRLLAQSLLSDAYTAHCLTTAATLEGFGLELIERITELQSQDANKHRKQKALVDVRKSLESMGVKWHEADIQKMRPRHYQSKLTAELNATQSQRLESMSVPDLFNDEPLTEVFTVSAASAHTVTDTYSLLYVLSGRVDSYIYRVVSLLLRMRTLVNNPHTDISAGEVRKGRGMMEFLASAMARLRMEIVRSGEAMNGLGQWIDAIQQRLSSSPPQAQSVTATVNDSVLLLWHHKRHIDSLIHGARYYELLYSRVLTTQRTYNDSVNVSLLTGQSTLMSLITSLEPMKSAIDSLIALFHPSILLPVQPAMATTGVSAIIGDRIADTVQQQRTELLRLVTSLRLESLPLVDSETQQFGRLFQSIKQSGTDIAAQFTTVGDSSESDAELLDRTTKSFGHIVQRVQLFVQSIKSAVDRTHSDTDGDSGSFMDEIVHLTGVLASHHTHQIHTALASHCQLLGQLSLRPQLASDWQRHGESLSLLLPLLEQSMLASHRTLTAAMTYLRSLSKMSYILLSSFTALLTHGYCGKEVEGEAEDSGKTDTGVEGTGMGEGQGDKDVSDQIEDEEQLTGTTDQKPEKQDNEKKDKSKDELDQGMDMEQEFDGEMFDVPSDEDEEKDKDDDKDDEEKDELDREMGELDDKQDVVDEKVWDESDEEEDQRDRTQEKQEQNNAINGPEDQVESVAKDDPYDTDTDDKSKDKDKREDKDEPQSKEPQPAPEPEVDVEDEEETGGVNDNDEDRLEESHNMEPFQLPEDVELGKDDTNDTEDAEDKGEDESGDTEEQPSEELTPEQKAELESKESEDTEENDSKENQPESLEQDTTDEKTEEDSEMPQAQDRIEVPDQNDNPADDADNAEEPPPQDEQKENFPQQQPKNQQAAHGVDRELGGNEGGGEQANVDQQDQPSQPQPQSNDDSEDASVNAANATEADSGQQSEWRPSAKDTQPPQPSDQPQSNQPKKTKQELKPNPYKSLGDSIKKWQQRLNIIDNDEDDRKEEKLLDSAEADGEEELTGAVENVDEHQHADAQMLGPVEEKNELPPLLDLADDTQPKSDEPVKAEEESIMKDEDDTNVKRDEQDNDDGASKRRGGRQKLIPSQQPQDDDVMDDTNDEAKEVEAYDPMKPDDHKRDNSDQADSSIAPVDFTPSTVDDRVTIDASESVIEAQSLTSNESESQSLWHQLIAQTSALSHSLCEMLRIILEPTLTSKLRGDFKTGKRLNLKKLIAYIASDYRKDKIWLRRVVPSKREYQIMLAIDDSESMRVNGHGRIALQSMTTLSQALTLLEVGELSVASFGDRVQLLHPFHQQWNDRTGAAVCQSFAFDQTVTRWPTTLEAIVKLMLSARQSQSSETLQLCLIVSDGNIQQDREQIRRWTRQALLHRLLLVLIVIDSGPRSITETRRFTGKADKPFQPYLEDFPFPYYLILRQVEHLPHILADALKQWFEAIQHIQ